MKKQVLAFVLVMVLVLPMFSVPAYAEYDEEIMFRNIPWGSNYYEVMEALEDVGIKEWGAEKPLTRLNIEASKNAMWISHESESVEPEKLGFCICVDGKKMPVFTVAGFEVSEITLYFAYTFAEDGTLLLDREHTALYAASYAFRKNTSQVSSSLLLKLRALYGKQDAHKSDTNGYKNAWYGKNGTDLFWFHNPDAMVRLTYLWEGIDALERKALDYLMFYYKENPGNIDGI